MYINKFNWLNLDLTIWYNHPNLRDEKLKSAFCFKKQPVNFLNLLKKIIIYFVSYTEYGWNSGYWHEWNLQGILFKETVSNQLICNFKDLPLSSFSDFFFNFHIISNGIALYATNYPFHDFWEVNKYHRGIGKPSVIVRYFNFQPHLCVILTCLGVLSSRPLRTWCWDILLV